MCAERTDETTELIQQLEALLRKLRTQRAQARKSYAVLEMEIERGRSAWES